MTLWYKYSFNDRQTDGSFTARVIVPADSPWFDGHFPEAPVLPGVAQLAMVHDLLCQARTRWSPLVRIHRARFKRMICPGQHLTLTVEPGEKEGGHRFRIGDHDGLICSGMMVLGNATETTVTR